jgi:HEPN domain-containing protein
MAEVAARERAYEWACFCAQQAAEKAVKALHLALGQEAWGHTVAKLLAELPCEVPQKLVERARFLDLYYVPSRYPNGFPEGAPFQHFGPQQAEEAVAHARAILEFVASRMA